MRSLHDGVATSTHSDKLKHQPDAHHYRKAFWAILTNVKVPYADASNAAAHSAQKADLSYSVTGS